jgi:hypothetical protein
MYFTSIYKMPDYRKLQLNEVKFDEDGNEEMHIDTGSGMNKSPYSGISVIPFTREDVIEAIKCSNFNKGLGPDCFDGNVLVSNTTLKTKVVEEKVNALSIASIPEDLRIGRLVIFQKS